MSRRTQNRDQDALHDGDPDDDAGDGPRPRKQRKQQKQQRKQRPFYSCAECRRLKMKCDRQVPCSNCVRRQRVDFCIPASSGQAGTGKVRDGKTIAHDQREPAETISPSKSASSSQPAQQSHLQTLENRGVFRSTPTPPYTHESIHVQDRAQDSSDHPHQINPENQAGGFRQDLDPLSLLAHALATQSSLPGTSTTPAHLPPIAESLYNVANSGATGPSHATAASRPSVDEEGGSYGTLMLSKRGRSKYLGPTAASEWLKESETQDVSDTPLVSRAHSPERPQDSVPCHQQPALSDAPYTSRVAFPLNTCPARVSTRELLSSLPPREEAWTLAEAYYRYCAWHHDVVPKAWFEKTFDRVYERAESTTASPAVNPQEIALVFIIMAQGTMFNIEMPHCDPSAEEWLRLSERALVKGDFLSNNMVAGLQTLHLMAHLHLHLDKDGRGDNAWPLWGLVMRSIQAMGMHRDGDRWNLPQDVVEERRKVFWECNAAETFQAHCFSRPSALNPDHCDTAFPSEPLKLNDEKSYSILRFELSQLSSEILNMAMKVRKPAYSDVIELDQRLCEFERNVPFYLRCRAALLAMPSRYPHVEAAIGESPEPSRRSLAISFQQTNLALNISETVINLHRPYYAKALHEVDRVESMYRPSFYTVIERCGLIINLVADIHARFPAVSTRQWNLWYHVFNSALCLGTLVLRDPTNLMASFVLQQIDAAISLFTSLLAHGARTPRYKSNLQWLLNLRTRALSKISEASNTTENGGAQRAANPDIRRNTNQDRDREGEENDEEDVELLGWRTRLIERAGQGGRRKVIRTIHLAGTPTDSQATAEPVNFPLYDSHTRGQLGPSDAVSAMPSMTVDSTNDVLRDFWDPMLLHDIFGHSDDHFHSSAVNQSTWWEDIHEVIPERM